MRSLESWQRVVASWIADPTQEKALILTSVLVDSRPVRGIHKGTPVADWFGRRRAIQRCCGCWRGSRSRTGRRPGSSAGSGLRLAHQVQQLREGQEPDDYVDPARLSK